MEKIWLKVEEVRLHSLHPTKSTDEEEKTIWASLRLDSALNINGIQINSKTNRKKDSWFSQNWALATARLLDVPALHKEDIRTPLLHDVLARAIYLFCHQKDGDKIRAFIENGGEEPQLPPFKPEDWKGLSLYVPVAFIKLRHFQCQTTQGPVRVDVQIGHHLILWSILIFDGDYFGLFDHNIQNPELVRGVNGMLQNERIQRLVSQISQRGYGDVGEHDFTEAIHGCETEEIPPVIFR